MPDRVSVLIEDFVCWMTAYGKGVDFTNKLHEMFTCIRISFERGGVSLYAQDGVCSLLVTDISYTTPLPEEFVGKSYLVHFDQLSKICSTANSKTLTFVVGKPGTLEIRAGSKYSLPAASGESYPSIPKISPEVVFQAVSDTSFIFVMDKMLPFAARDLVRPELAGVAISEHLYISTAGFFGVVHPRLEGGISRVTLLPAAVKILTAVKDFKGLEIAVTDQVFVARTPRFMFVSNLPVISFPYEGLYSVLKQKSSPIFKARVGARDFLESLCRGLVLATEKLGQFRFEFSVDSVRVFFRDGKNFVSFDDSVPCTYESPLLTPYTILTSLQAVDALRKLFAESGDTLVITIVSPTSPIFVQQVGSKYLFWMAPAREVSND